jgi:two-component system, NarL family, nitrate/nitrite response regulator NarL
LTHPEIGILIADDHSIFRDGLRRLLEAEPGFCVIGEATNGEEALVMTKDLQPDVLLLDVSMPRLSGLEVLRRLPKEFATHILLLTAHIEKAEVVDALLLGAQGVVPKQSASEMLFKSIRTVMAGEFWVSRDMTSELVGALRGPLGLGPKSLGLTRRELEVIEAVVGGRVNKDIAQTFNISEYTVKHHLTRIFDKLGVTNRVELAMFAVNHDLVKQLEDMRDEETA